MTSTPELTTRDVLHQIDRRLTLIEEDLRALHIETASGLQRLDTKIDRLDTQVDTKFGELDTKIDAKIGGLDLKIDTKVGDAYHRLDAKIDARFGELDAKIDIKIAGLDTKIGTNLRWTAGIVLASWLSLMGAVLLK